MVKAKIKRTRGNRGHRRRMTGLAGLTMLAAAMAFGSGLSAQPPAPGAEKIVVHELGTMVTFAGGTAKSGGQIHVRIDGPDGNNVFEASSKSGLIDWALKSDLPDGRYKYDVWFITAGNPVPDKSPSLDSVKRAMYDTSMMADDSANKGVAPLYDSGVFLIQGGTIEGGIVRPSDLMGESPDLDLSSIQPAPSRFEQAVGSLLNFLVPAAHADQFIADDLTLQDATPCLRFEDTDTTGSDWNVCAWDEQFGIFDNSTSDYSLWIDPGAPANSIFVESSTGSVGFGTNTPATRLEVVDNFPNISFRDADNGNKDYELLNNGGIFFLIDRTTGAIPINVQNNTSGFALTINDNNVGVGNFVSPTAPLHVRKNDGTSKLIVEESSGTAAARELFKLSNNGGPFFIFENTDISQSYSFAMGATGHFLLSHQQTGGVQMRLTPTGNMTITGSLVEGSSRTIKDGITPIDPATMLAKLDALPVSEWNYEDVPGSRHVGPMAEDFHAVFGFGPDDKHIAPRDLAGVALAAAKALKIDNDEKNGRIAELEARMARLEALLTD